ncbi:phosphoglycerate mutase-like protein [Leucogyrophana mollusca]|uniref:Phosphoglycerate mutase-like protein n=1 Tax=Leucogyrophana mollusca TaxID=85980 RepID=A0ACB8BAW2_9AGAM|nr:phosphoglycerate mutase-like protein [Leucogyrophana mollusca]
MTNETKITVTFIRHGESTDNLKSVWAGWKDAPLSNHGMNQARAMGQAFSNTHLTAIYASPLKRAFATAEALRDAQPKPLAINESPLLREQHFGIAEGKAWVLRMELGKTVEEYWANGEYPVLHKRHQRFPEGESRDELAERADEAIRQIVLPEIWQAARSGAQGVHLALVSHGLCISELVPALVKKGQNGMPAESYEGLMNTAWTRVAVSVKGTTEGEPLQFADDAAPALEVRVTDVNRHEHIDSIKRQKGGIGSAAHDPNQQDIRAFFGGGGMKKPVEAQEHSESNAGDEVGLSQE